MKYKFVGLKAPYVGKPIWEIVGNLKNFGVGRLIVEDKYKNEFALPTFYKIVKVVPSKTPIEIGKIRQVLVWTEMVFKGKKIIQPEQLHSESHLTKFHLVPKEDEVKYLGGIKQEPDYNFLPKYQTWPPLYKIILKRNMNKFQKSTDPVPPLKTIIPDEEKTLDKISEEETTEGVLKSDLFILDEPVEVMYRKVWMLRRKLGIPEREEKAD